MIQSVRSLWGKGTPRKLSGKMGVLFTVCAVALAVYSVYFQIYAHPTPIVYRGIFVAAVLVLTFLLYKPTEKGSELPSVFDWLAIIVSLATGVYVLLNADRLLRRIAFVDDITQWDALLCLILVVLAFEATRRVVGPVLPGVGLVAILYAVFSGYVPGRFHVAGGVPLKDFVEAQFLTTGGLYGLPIAIVATYVVMFMIFGEFLSVTGAGESLFDLAKSVAGRFRGGIAKTSVVASAAFGMINGSAVSNVTTTGAFTIPMMKRSGYPAHIAGAVEAAASSGGVIMPPVMGAVGFVMAEVVGVPYGQVMIAAFLPGLLYYLAIFLSIDFEAGKRNIVGLDKEDVPKLTAVLPRLLFVVVPIFWLIYRLVNLISPSRAAYEAIILLVLFSFLRRKNRPTFVSFIKSLEKAVTGMLMIASACIIAGMIQGVVQVTGAGVKFSALILSLGQSYLLPAALLTAVLTIILGMGLNITPSYILAASLAVPAMVKLGVPAFSANFFIVYYAAMSNITPPVALASYAASSIANADFMKVGWAAVRLAIVGFVVPFTMIYRPEILLIGSVQGIVVTLLQVILAIYALVCVVNNRLLDEQMNIAEFMLLIAGSTIVLLFGKFISWLGVLAIVLVIARKIIMGRTPRIPDLELPAK